MTIKSLKGFWLEGDSAKKVWDNSVSGIIKDKHYRFALGGDYYLLDDAFCYGVVTLTGVSRVEPSEFHKLFDKHMVDNKERMKRWKTANKIMYLYDFELNKRFENPYKILTPTHVNPFVDDFLVLEEIKSNEIFSKDEYIVKALNDGALKNGWDNVLKWCSSVKDGGVVGYSEKSVINLVEYLYEELTHRKISFNLSEIPSNCRALFHKISGNICYKVELLNSQLTIVKEEVGATKQFNNINNLSSTLFKDGG